MASMAQGAHIGFLYSLLRFIEGLLLRFPGQGLEQEEAFEM